MFLGQWRYILLSLVLVVTGAFRLALLDRPFQRDPEGCAAFFGQLARNYFRYDWGTTLGVPVMSMGAGAEVVFYANHPPITALLIALMDAATGYRGSFEPLPPDWTVRAPTTLFTLGCIVLLYALVRNRASERAGLLAAAIFASIPMTLLYGGFADVINPQLLFFALLTVAAYERFHDKPDWRGLCLLCATFTGAALIDWPAFYLAPVLGLHFLATRPRRQWAWIIGLGVVSVFIFTALYAQLAIAQHDWFWMDRLVKRRALSNLSDAATHRFTLGQWLHQTLWVYVTARHTLFVVIAAIAWLALSLRRRFSRVADRFTGLLLAWAIVHALVGRQGMFQHEWWWWPLTPGLVIAAALAVDELLSWIHRRLGTSQTGINVGLSLLLILFAGWNARGVLREIQAAAQAGAGQIDYTTSELGQVIRQNAPPQAAVMLAESDNSLPLWHYADRPMKRQIWTVEDFHRRLHDSQVELAFETVQRWDGPVAAMIVPRIYAPKGLEPLVDYLDAHYARHDTEKFLVYLLNRPKAP